jgi:hypothetical protein
MSRNELQPYFHANNMGYFFPIKFSRLNKHLSANSYSNLKNINNFINLIFLPGNLKKVVF